MPCLTGSEFPAGDGLDLREATVLDFWQWAFSSLQENTVRGVFAEWLVGRLLGVEMETRTGWDAFDLVTPESWTVEVKCAAYQQAWHAAGVESARISFGPLLSRTWTPETNYADARTHNAQVYVFCLQTSRPPQSFDALDLDQWTFYVAPVETLHTYPYRSIGLNALAKLAVGCTASTLRRTVADVMGAGVTSRQTPATPETTS